MENARNEADHDDQIREEEIEDDSEPQLVVSAPQKPADGLASNSRPEDDEQAQVSRVGILWLQVQ